MAGDDGGIFCQHTDDTVELYIEYDDDGVGHEELPEALVLFFDLFTLLFAEGKE